VAIPSPRSHEYPSNWPTSVRPIRLHAASVRTPTSHPPRMRLRDLHAIRTHRPPARIPLPSLFSPNYEKEPSNPRADEKSQTRTDPIDGLGAVLGLCR
jgi:hypothetical protein